ncbi:MAG TPA: hypothetical protein VLA24_14165 [Pseudomonadales bacterium]|nr:hypothetical protein [Pseudomonadales bacterium]
MTAKELHDINKYLTDLQFVQANAIVGVQLQNSKKAIAYMERLAELRELIKLEAGLKENEK